MHNQAVSPQTVRDDDEVNLVDLIRAIVEEWKLVVGAMVAMAALALIVSATMTPIYRADVAIAEADADGRRSGAAGALGQLGGLAGLAGIDLRALSGGRGDGRRLIQSRTFFEEFISRYDLLPILYADEWEQRTTPPNLWTAARRMQRDVVQLESPRELGVMVLRVEWTDPEIAAQWANALVRLANDVARERDIRDAERSIAYLNDQLAKTSVVELRNVLYSLLEGEQRTLMLAAARDEYAFTVIDPAVVPSNPVRPSYPLMTALGIIGGGAFGLFLVASKRLWRRLRRENDEHNAKRENPI